MTGLLIDYLFSLWRKGGGGHSDHSGHAIYPRWDIEMPVFLVRCFSLKVPKFDRHCMSAQLALCRPGELSWYPAFKYKQKYIMYIIMCKDGMIQGYVPLDIC